MCTSWKGQRDERFAPGLEEREGILYLMNGWEGVRE